MENKSVRLDIVDLKEANDFLNILYDNITSALFIADSDPRIQSFNDTFQTLFYKPEDQILKQLCGNAIGCSFQVEEDRDCGTTSNCCTCVLRRCITTSMRTGQAVFRENLVRRFYIRDSVVEKHLSFSTRPISYNDESMVLVIVDDITDLEKQKILIEERNRHLSGIIRERMMEIVELGTRLTEEVHEREELLKEVHHRVGNNLQLLSSLINLQSAADPLAKASDINEQMQKRLHTLKMIYSNLIHFNRVSKVNFGDLLERLTRELAHAHHINTDRTRIVIESDTALLPIETAMPLGLIINEMFSLRCAHRNTGPAGRIIIALKRLNNQYVLSMDFPFTEDAAGANVSPADRISMQFIGILSRQLNAELQSGDLLRTSVRLLFSVE